MGYDIARFVDTQINKELLCPICNNVLECAVWSTICEHAFCHECIYSWIDLHHESCPLDRLPMTHDNLKPAPRILRNLLAELEITCDFSEHGCDEIYKLESLASHRSCCDFNPDKLITCDQGCGAVFKKSSIDDHICVRYLMKKMAKKDKAHLEKEEQLQKAIDGLKKELSDVKDTVREIYREMKGIPKKVGGRDNSLSSSLIGKQSVLLPSTPESGRKRARPTQRIEPSLPNPYVLISPLPLTNLPNRDIAIPTSSSSSSHIRSSFPQTSIYSPFDHYRMNLTNSNASNSPNTIDSSPSLPRRSVSNNFLGDLVNDDSIVVDNEIVVDNDNESSIDNEGNNDDDGEADQLVADENDSQDASFQYFDYNSKLSD